MKTETAEANTSRDHARGGESRCGTSLEDRSSTKSEDGTARCLRRPASSSDRCSEFQFRRPHISFPPPSRTSSLSAPEPVPQTNTFDRPKTLLRVWRNLRALLRCGPQSPRRKAAFRQAKRRSLQTVSDTRAQ